MEEYDQIFCHVKKIAEECAERELPVFNGGSRWKEDLGFDSVMIVNLQILLEDHFDFVFDPIEDDFEKIFETVENVCAYLRKIME